MNARFHRSRILLLAIGSLSLFASACSSSGSGSDAAAAPKTTTTTAAGKTTTTEAEATTTTDVKDDRPTKADLEVILPTAADIGTGWTLDPPDDDEDTESDQALEEQCPAFANLGTGDQEGDVKHAFTGPQDAQIAVTLSNDADEVSEAELEDQLTAINDCDPITYTDRGLTTTLDIQVTADDSYGDFGARMQADVTLESSSLPEPLELTLYGLMFRIDEVGVSITGSDGLDDDTLKVAPIETDLLLAQAEAMEKAIANLGAG